MDDGDDAQEISERLLRAAPRLLDREFAIHTFFGTWKVAGALGLWTRYDRESRLDFRRAIAAHLQASYVAASYCARGTSRGISLWREDGALWQWGSVDGALFNSWILGLLPAFRFEAGDTLWRQ